MKLTFNCQGDNITCSLDDIRNIGDTTNLEDLQVLNVVTDVLNLLSDNIKNMVVDQLSEGQ